MTNPHARVCRDRHETNEGATPFDGCCPLTMEDNCRKCGKPLSSRDSRTKGFGPVCDSKHVWKKDISITDLLHPDRRKPLRERVRAFLRRGD